jgi:hypothetical protein
MTRRGPRLAGAALVALLLCGGAARGHIVYGRPTLLSLVGGAERVAHVQIVDPSALVVLEESGERRPVVVASLRTALKGGGESGENLRFATHGHGMDGYLDGEEGIVFLAPLERSRELAALAAAGVRWVSFQDHDVRYVVTPENRARLLGAIQAYVAAEALAEPGARLAALRRVTLDLIGSGDLRLASGAVQDLALSGDLPLVTAADAPGLVERVVTSPAHPLGVRLALLSELDRRRLVDGPSLWLALLRDTPMPDRVQVARVAGRHPSPAVGAELVALLGSDDDALAAGAALALGSPAHAQATPSLARALEHPDPRVRRAAIRALAAIGTPAARDVLAAAGESHDDPDTRRRAAAAVRALDR